MNDESEASPARIAADRVAEVMVGSTSGQDRRGSAYRLTRQLVLTAGHVVAAAQGIVIRFNAGQAGEWHSPATIVWSDTPDLTDLAFVRLTEPQYEVDAPAEFGRLQTTYAAVVECSAVGFPLFKRRGDTPRDGLGPYRDRHQAHGTISTLSNSKSGTFELVVSAAPAASGAGESTPQPANPWGGMSGAAVWSRGRIIGVVTDHYQAEGPAVLTSSPIERVYQRLAPETLAELRSLGLALPARSDDLPDVTLADASGLQHAPPRRTFEPELVLVPAGVFLMGVDGGRLDYEMPRQEVQLGAYRIATESITNAQYKYFVDSARIPVASAMGWALARVGQEPPPGMGDHPLVGVTWEEAVACRWLGRETGRSYRLPTEAEWEKAARGTDGRRYPWGETFDASRCTSAASGATGTSATGSHASDASIYGCHDMVGNVWEWTSTSWGLLPGHPQFEFPYVADDGRERLDQTTAAREYRICRGGSYLSGPAEVTCTARRRYLANSRDARRGFRVAMDA